MELIPAIDIIEGKCVRLTKGDYGTKKIYNENPLEVARAFQDAGLRRLHLVDLDGARESQVINWQVLEQLALKTELFIDWGGGLKSDEDLRIVFECGARQATGGSIAVKAPDTFTSWIEKYGGEKIILGADVKEEKIAISGWQEETEIGLMDFLGNYMERGIEYCICTDVARDGMLKGTNMELYERILDEFPKLKLIASGGVTTMQELEQLRKAGLYGAIIGKAIYEGALSLKELEVFQQSEKVK